MEQIVTEKNGPAIQRAIDAAARAGGGRVSLEPGVYPSGTLYLADNVELHLPAGAKIQGYGDPGRYDDFRDPGFDAVAPENSRKCLIACKNCVNVAITGQGEINGSGPEFYDRNVPEGAFFAKPPVPRPRMVQFYNCRNVRFEGVSFVDSPGWTFWLIACENVTVSRVEVRGCQQMINNDGIDIDGCRRVAISDSFFRTGDDCLILRAIRRNPDLPSVCEEVAVTNCVLDSRCQGIRLGCPSDDTIRNCTFSNIIFRGSGSAVHCENPYRYLRQGCTGYMKLSDIAFTNCDFTTERYPVRICCEGSIRLRGIERITFSGLRFRSKLPLFLEGNSETVLREIRFTDVRGEVEGDDAIHTKFVEHLRLENFDVTARSGESPEFRRGESASWETKF